MKSLVILACVCVAMSAVAEETDLVAANKRIAELENKVRLLEARAKMLESDLAAAKAELVAREQVSADANDTDELADPMAVSAETEHERVKTYGDIGDLLNELPGDLKPSTRGGWDKFTLPKVAEWIGEEPVGHSFARQTRITSIKARRNLLAGNAPGREWIIEVDLEGKSVHYMGMTITDRVAPVTYYGDADFAKAAEAVRVNVTVNVTGKIDKLTLAGFDSVYAKDTAIFSLSDVTIHHDLFRQYQSGK